VSRYAEALAAALIEGSVTSACGVFARRVPRLSVGQPERLALAWSTFRATVRRDVLRGVLDTPRLPKLGLVGFDRSTVVAWCDWLLAVIISRPDLVIGVLSRGLTDAAVVARALGCELAFVACSHHRLRARGVIYASPSVKHAARRVLVVDAHSATGATIHETLKYCASARLDVVGIVISACDDVVAVAAQGFELHSRLDRSALFLARGGRAETSH
jgi:adenine/guanine phosphoribosyltransferase-like PRPP-binding protein